MSEERTPYLTTNTTLHQLGQRDCARPFSDDLYRPPTSEEVKALIELAGWSQNDVAKITGVSYNTKKGSSTVRKWKAPEGEENHRQIPYSAWRLLLINAGIASK